MIDIQSTVNEHLEREMIRAYMEGVKKTAAVQGLMLSVEMLNRLQTEAQVFASEKVYGL